MKESLVDDLRCPVDGGRLRLEVGSRAPSGEIQSGQLISASARRYGIEQGVPNLAPEFRSAPEQSTVEAFGREWGRYRNFDGFMGSEAFFHQFTGLSRQDVAGKRVLEVGCGGGRWLRILSEMGAHSVIGLEYSAAAHEAAAYVSGLPNVEVVRGSALAVPLAPNFDLVISIGVIHHLADPAGGLQNIRKVVAPVHNVVIWVYAHEGNELYLAFASPLRWVTSRCPERLVVLLSKCLASLLWLHIRTVNKMALSIGLRLPLREYLAMLGNLRHRDLELITFDQLTPQLARYPRRSEVLEWITAAGGVVDRMHHRTGNSWQVHYHYPVSLLSPTLQDSCQKY